MAHRPIAYTYEADHHCEECTLERFGDTYGVDREGNEVHAVFSWDEWWNTEYPNCEYLSCGDCHGVLAEAHKDECSGHF